MSHLSLPEVEIELQRGTAGLGFNIRGGNDIPHIPDDPGIFVTKIRENGAAAMDGRLQEGDKIIEINGIDIEDVNHSAAVSLFVNAGEHVKLKVLKGAEAAVVAQREAEGKSATPNNRSKSSGRSILPSILILGAAIVIGIVIYKYRR